MLSSWSEGKYKSDWNMNAEFFPKDSYSEKERGKVWAHYKEGKGLVIAIALYDQKDQWNDRFLSILEF